MIAFRTATMDDADILFRWRNDELTCAMSRNTEPVKYEDHIVWLTKRLSSRKPLLFIVLNPEPVGTFRIDNDEISYTVAPEYRGRGIAKAMLIEARKCFGTMHAEIFKRNIPSIACAKTAGMIVDIID